MSLDDPISEFVQEGRKKKERASVDFRKDSGDSGFHVNYPPMNWQACDYAQKERYL